MAGRVWPRRGCKCFVLTVVTTVIFVQACHVLQFNFMHLEHIVMTRPAKAGDKYLAIAVMKSNLQKIRQNNGAHRLTVRHNSSKNTPGTEADQFRDDFARGTQNSRKTGEASGNQRYSKDTKIQKFHIRNFAVGSAGVTQHDSSSLQPQGASGSRLSLAESVCRSNGSQIRGRVEKVYVYEAEKVAYCSTHKIASTYWLRVYRWLYNDTMYGHVASPLVISKFDTHLLPLTKLKVRNLAKNQEDDRALVEASYRFLFTRDPYARLWSVYIDKFVLPDNYFWSNFAPKIKKSVHGKQAKEPAWTQSEENDVPTSSADLKENVSRARHLLNQFIRTQKQIEHHSDEVDEEHRRNMSQLRGTRPILEPAIKRPLQGPVPIAFHPRELCLQVTFNEFLQYIVNVAVAHTGQALDDHFRPVHYGCNPCHFRPHFIGKMETMKEDSTEVLRQMKLDRILPELNLNHVQQEIDMLISFNFDLVTVKRLQRRCVNDVDLERRLITAFIYNGYIPVDSEKQLEKRLPLGMVNLREAVLNLYYASGRTSEDVRQQREKFKWQAFRHIPKELLTAVQKVFYWDFALFGYDPFPPEIFGTS